MAISLNLSEQGRDGFGLGGERSHSKPGFESQPRPPFFFALPKRNNVRERERGGYDSRTEPLSVIETIDYIYLRNNMTVESPV